MLNKLHFDFRNAKRAFLGVSFCRLDDVGTNSVVQQTELGCGESTGQVVCNQADAVKCNVKDIGADNNAGHLVAGSAVQVDDGDAEGLTDVSEAAVVPHHSKSEQPDTSCTSPSVTTEYIQYTDQCLPSCNASKSEILRPSDASICSTVDSFQCQMETNQQIDLPCLKKSGRGSKRNDKSVAKNQTDVRVADGIVLKPLSVLVNEPRSCKDSVSVALQSHSTVESYGNGGCSSTSPIVLYDDDDFDDVALTEGAHAVQPPNRAKKSYKSENAHSLHNVTVTGIKLEPKCKDGKLKVVRTKKRRRRKKHDLDDEVWSMQKKLLIMPDDKKFAKSGHSRKQKVRRNTFSRTAKSKACKSVSVEGMELPDLSTTLDSGANGTDVSDFLKMYDQESEVYNTASRKWYVDVTGADLDIDYKCATNSSGCPKHLISNKAAEQNVGELLPQFATDTECHRTNFSSSQETPPPSVASSDGCSFTDEPDQSLNSNTEDTEIQDSGSKRLTIYTKLAHYIDGRRFDRLVNGVSVQLCATVTDEAVGQFGQECLRLARLTKRDVKELQDQVRLEEIYHRRVKKATLLLHGCSNENVRHRLPLRHNVSGFVPKSAAKRTAKSKRSGDAGIETGTAEADAANQQSASFSTNDELRSLAAETEKSDTVNSRAASVHGHINLYGAKQRESAKMGMNVRNSRQASAANQSRIPVPVCEPIPTGIIFHKQTSTMNNCNVSEPVAAFRSPEERLDAFLRQELVTDSALLQKSNSFGFTNNHFAADADSMQHATMDGVAMTTDAAGTDDSEYMAAVALASLSVVTENQLYSIHQLLSYESKELTDATLQIKKQRKSSQKVADVAVNSRHPQEFLPQNLSKQSKVSEAVTTTSLVKQSKHAATSNGRRLKAGERRSHRLSTTDKQHERSPKDSVNDHMRNTPCKQRSRDQRSHSVRTACSQKSAEEEKETLPTTCSSKSAINFHSDLSGVAMISNVDKKKTANAATASDISPKSNKSDASDKMKHRRESCHSGVKRKVDCSKQKQVAGDGSLGCDFISSVQPVVASSHYVTDVVLGRSDLPAIGENALPLGDTTVTVAGGSASNSVLCSSSPGQSSLQSSSSSHSLTYSVVGCSDKGTKVSLRLRRTDPPASSLTSENNHVESESDQYSETIRKTTATGCKFFSDLNSNSVSKSLQMLPSFDDINAVQVMSGKADRDVALPSISDGEIVSRSCSVARSDDKTVCTEAADLLQSSMVLDNYTPDLPAFLSRETEDIGSPSPVHADVQEDGRAGEIRSPSPCDVESPEEVFHVVETSWDVKLSSPCEIQSPDGSDNEADDSVEQFNGHCNVCFQHGPVTIPLNMEEAVEQNSS